MRKRRIIVLLLCMAALWIGVKIALGVMVGNVRRIPVMSLDFGTLADGTYAGEYSIAPVSVTVEVTVEGSKVTAIDITRHENGLGGKAERIVSDVMQEQSLEVDAVTGATVSSKCILKAIEDALQKAGGGNPEDAERDGI